MSGSDDWSHERLKLAVKGDDDDDYWKKRGRGSSVFPSFGHSGVKAGSSKQAPGDDALTRFAAVASGSQPAVVKVASYGGGGRFGAMVSYVSRHAEISVEDDRGRIHSTADDMAALSTEWEDIFDYREESRDVAVFEMSIAGGGVAQAQQALQDVLGDRRYVFSLSESLGGRIQIDGVAVLRDDNGQRLSGDREASAALTQRLTTSGRPEGSFRFRAYGNGVEYGTAQVRRLVRQSDSQVQDEQGRLIGDTKAAGDLVQKTWRPCLQSRRGRDVMHLVMSARAGTEANAFEAAARDFLAEQFAGHRYVFSQHDPFSDPKEEGEGGKRPHIHVHAIISTRDRSGRRLRTSPQVFKGWRKMMAEKARDHGIAMEGTDRREFAAPAAYSKNQVRAVNTSGRTEHEGTSESAQRRYTAKRAGNPILASSPRSIEVAKNAIEMWRDISELSPDKELAEVAENNFKAMSKAFDSAIEISRNQHVDPSKSIYKFDTILTAMKEGLEMDFENITREQYEEREKAITAAKTKAEAKIREEGLDPDVILKDIYARIDEYMSDVRSVVERNEGNQKTRSSEQKVASETNNQEQQAVSASDSAYWENLQEQRGIEGAQKTDIAPMSASQQTPTVSLEKTPIAEQAEIVRDESAPVAAMAVGREETPFPEDFNKRFWITNSSKTDRVYADGKGNVELFQASENRLRTKLFNERAVSLMLDTAAHRGWTSIEAKGSKDFRREAWLEGQARGIAVLGYKPTELDRQELIKREQNFLQNEIVPLAERVQTAMPGRSSQAENTSQDLNVMQDPTNTVMQDTTSKKQDLQSGIRGELLEAGSRPYQDRKDADPSPYVVLQNGSQKVTLWGVGIPDALQRADAKVGDVIELREAGMEKVTKSIIKEVNGEKVREEALVDRRRWEAELVSERTNENKTQLPDENKVEKAPERNDTRTNETKNAQATTHMEQLQLEAKSRNKDDRER
ncbi:relaxase [Agrobacterium vitis]|uniref:LPD7 domain-containing protein n=1 Tax=Allorhizobium ampelinum TaxID=3025782 RepID=UPI001F1A8361|nr:LPD7 domain-containing protein [Allorhizobium ampelinum]MCF1450161.1 relaxase [Allorhizobium ampelinum]